LQILQGQEVLEESEEHPQILVDLEELERVLELLTERLQQLIVDQAEAEAASTELAELAELEL
jgi:hypothetical protein